MSADSRTHLPSGTQVQTRYISTASADLMTEKGIGTQALYGQRFDLVSIKNDRAYGALYSVLQGVDRIDYVGTVPASSLSTASHDPSHHVHVLSAAIFNQADIKSELKGRLPRNAVLQGEIEANFIKLREGGYIHSRHVLPMRVTPKRGYTDVAADMLGLPYIWGGTGHIGVDCSGLVQSALAAIGIDVPRDADQQEVEVGHALKFENRKAGDLLFWAGHVGIVVAEDKLLHANAYHMLVAIEPVSEAVKRIGAVRTVKRL